MTTMFPIHIHEEGKALPEDPICYIIAKEGIYLKKNLGIMNSIAKVDSISILASIETSATMNIPKIPSKLIGKIFAFFREVYKEHSSEAVVILFYNSEKKVFRAVPPLQKVSGAGLSYDRNISYEGFDKIGSIHSHANFSAFHSGIDDSDEWSFDGLHLTFGHCGCTDNIYTVAASICSNKQRFVVDPLDYINGIAPVVQPTPTTPQVETFRSYGPKHYRWENGKLVEFSPYQSAYQSTYSPSSTYDKRYTLTVKNPTFNKEWMKLVEKQTYTYATPGYQHAGVGRFDDWDEYYAGGGMYQPGQWYSYLRERHPVVHGQRPWQRSITQEKYTQTVDPDAWKNNRHVVVKNGRVCIIPGANPPPSATPSGQPIQNVGVKVKPIEFPPHDLEDDDDLFPCKHCLFRDTKIEWAIQMYTEEVEDNVPESKEVDNYKPDPRTFPELQRAEGEGMPIVINGPSKDAEMYFCMECKRSTWVDPKDKADCPVCESPMIHIERKYEGYNREVEIHQQAASDSGELLIPNGDEFEKAVKEAATLADRERVLLPVPDKPSIPIGLPPRTRFSVRKLLQICRGKK